MRYSRHFLLIVFWLTASFVKSQSPGFNFHKLGSEEGLQSSNIFSIHQHPNGLIYISTQNGIYQYDGYNFVSLNIDSLKSNALITAYVKDSASLYISVNEEGIAEYNLLTKKYSIPSSLRYSRNNSEEFSITKGFAYLLTPQIRLTIIDLKNGTVIKDEMLQKDPANFACCIYKTKEGTLLLGRKEGLYELKEGKQVKQDYLKNVPVHSLSQTGDGKLVIGSNNKIVILKDKKIEQEIPLKIKSSTLNIGGGKSVDKIICDAYGKIWFTVYPNENLYLYRKGQVYDLFETLDLQPELIKCIFKDRNENIWLGTLDDGVYFFRNPEFDALNFSYNNKILNVNKVFLKDNLLLAGTGNGLFAYNLLNAQSKIVSKPDPVFTEPVNAIREIDGGIYYASTKESELRPSVVGDSKHTYRIRPVGTSQFIALGNNKLVITGRLATVLLYNVSSLRVEDTLISFPQYRISVNCFLRKGDTLLVGTNSGLYVYSFSKKTYQLQTAPELNFRINDLAYAGGKIYAAHDAGITEVESKQLIQQVGGIKLNSVKKIAADGGVIWLGTNNGVLVCTPSFIPLKRVDKTSGRPSGIVNDIVFSDKFVCIATARGLVIAETNSISRAEKLKPVIIDVIKVNGEEIKASQNAIHLLSDQENLQLRFYSPFYNRPNKQVYRYRLDKGEWNNINDNSLSLSIEKGGEHLLEISASADNIGWSEASFIRITKEKALSESAFLYWIITLGGLLLISAVSFVVIRKVRATGRKRLEDERQMNLLKHQAMNSLLSPHFIFNSLTSIQNYINSNNSLKASEYLAKFSRLIRMIIEKAAQGEITLADELSRLNYYLDLEKERFKNKFDYHIHVDEKLNRSEIKIPNMIIQPHVENCIIHGILPKMEPGRLNISFLKKENDKLLIRIEDDGIGLIKAKEHAKTGHKSLGTSTIKNILEINSKLTGKTQSVSMADKSTLSPPTNGTLIEIELQL